MSKFNIYKSWKNSSKYVQRQRMRKFAFTGCATKWEEELKKLSNARSGEHKKTRRDVWDFTLINFILSKIKDREKRMTMRWLIINGWIILPINTQHRTAYILRKKLSKKKKLKNLSNVKEKSEIFADLSSSAFKINKFVQNLSRSIAEWRLMWNDIFLKLSWLKWRWMTRSEMRGKIDGWSLWKMKYKWKLRNDFSEMMYGSILKGIQWALFTSLAMKSQLFD